MRDIQRNYQFERNVFLVNDLIGALTAVDRTAQDILQYLDTPESRAYAAGHRSALMAMAESLNIANEFRARVRGNATL